MTRDPDAYSGTVPPLLLTVGFFLIAEAVTFTTLALHSHGAFRVDILDLAFVLAGALAVTVIGLLEGRRLRSGAARLFAAALLGVCIGIAAGFGAIWFGRLGH
jgi:hypothetical protein